MNKLGFFTIFNYKVQFRVFDLQTVARIVRAGEASSEAERRNEGSTKCVRNPEKPDFCEAKSHPKNKNSKLDICPIK